MAQPGAGPQGPTAAHDAPSAPPGADRAERISGLEWLVAGLGLLLVVAAVVFMVVDATRGGDAPPFIRVRADSVIAVGEGGYLLLFTAENRGRETAADVGVIGELRDATDVEVSRARVDYVPGRSERRGGLFFRRDPRRTAVRLWAEGYQEP
jgi:uncharacterized protein (TIGR02588 family)